MQNQEKPSISTGLFLPPKVLTNAEIESWGLSTGTGRPITASWLSEKLGIHERHIASADETPLFMARESAEKALIERPNIDRIIGVLVSSSFPTAMHMSKELAGNFGLEPQFAYDIHAACSGIPRGINYLAKREKMGGLNEGDWILIVATEKYSPFLHDIRDGKDPAFAQTIFSDGAAAMLFRWGVDLKVVDHVNYQFPREYANLIRMPIDQKMLNHPYYIEEPIARSETGFVEMDGPKVKKAVVKHLPGLIRQVAPKNAADGKTKIIAHQASATIVDDLAQRMPEYDFYEYLKNGNFSSASITMAFDKAAADGWVKKGDSVVFAGFGAGLFASVFSAELN